MAKKQNVIKALASERYLIWAVVFTVVVGVGLLTEINRAKAEMDIEMSSSMFLINLKK